MPPAGYPAFLQYLQSGRVRKNPPMTVEEFLPKLEDVGLPGTAACLRNCANRL